MQKARGGWASTWQRVEHLAGKISTVVTRWTRTSHSQRGNSISEGTGVAPRGPPLRARPPSQSHHAAEKGEEANGGHREPVSGARDFLQGWAPLELGPENNEEHFETF